MQRIAIIQFPGSNCERETRLAVQRAGMTPVEYLWNESQEKLTDFAGFIIVGGFSYEDRARAGVIAAFDPIMSILKEQSQRGKPILGICNGAQILVESGLVPGLENHEIGMTLTDNKRMKNGKIIGTGYYNEWVHMRLADYYQFNAFTKHLSPKHILKIPIAHAEGRFIIPPALLREMQNNGQLLFQYSDAAGNIKEFPVNPNGSIMNVAAVSNKAGNVLAMMPHPERTIQGDPIFQSMSDYIKEGYTSSVLPLNYSPRKNDLTLYPKKNHECIVKLIITDNQAVSVQNALQIPINRYIHWEIACDSPDILDQIKASDVLFYDRKEKLIFPDKLKDDKQMTLLVRAKEDLLGQQKMQILKKHFNINGIHSIRHSVLWQFAKDQLESVLNSHILFNPYAHECYEYNK